MWLMRVVDTRSNVIFAQLLTGTAPCRLVAGARSRGKPGSVPGEVSRILLGSGGCKQPQGHVGKVSHGLDTARSSSSQLRCRFVNKKLEGVSVIKASRESGPYVRMSSAAPASAGLLLMRSCRKHRAVSCSQKFLNFWAHVHVYITFKLHVCSQGLDSRGWPAMRAASARIRSQGCKPSLPHTPQARSFL